MVYLYDACVQISNFCQQQLLRKMWRKISWTDGRTDGQTDRGKTVYPPPPSESGGIKMWHWIYMHIFRHIFLSNYWWLKSDIWSQASYMYPISWEAFLDPSDSYFLFADFVDFYTHWTYILYLSIFSHIFLSNYWWQKSDIWSQASYRYPISWEAFLDPSDSYFLFAEEQGYHKWALAHSSSCLNGLFIRKRLSVVVGLYWPV